MTRGGVRGWLAALGLLLAMPAGAAGLGEVLHHSALYQPLDVEIAASLDASADPDDVRVQVADTLAYASLGIDRSPALRSTLATLSQRGSGLVVRITSNDPVREPVLRLVVELVAGGSRVRRSYDLLLDPSPSRPLEPPVRGPEAETAPKPRPFAPAVKPAAPTVAPRITRPAPRTPLMSPAPPRRETASVIDDVPPVIPTAS
ncbi:MAG TPA: hypothetical protein VJM11_17455, partial [Nevskiaceae bacterium]|nr:hypothetical protein [Nevskiaceae bacterium]